MKLKKAIITGATGFIGRHLTKMVEHPIVVGRSLKKLQKIFPKAECVEWHPPDLIPKELFEGVEVVFHLAGENIYKGRWNEKKKKRILESRQIATRTIVDSMCLAKKRPKAFISSSAVGFYGDCGEDTITEEFGPGTDFLSEVCQVWELEALRATSCGVRVVVVRTGIVLDAKGGALAEMLKLFKLGLGGKLGKGSQYMPWIHIDDLISIMAYCAENEKVSGPVNAVAPNPVTNQEFTKILAKTIKRPAFIPVPAPVLKLVVGEFADALLASQKVMPQKLLRLGYQFKYPELSKALENLLERNS